MNMHLRYWWAKLKNDFRQITFQRLDESTMCDQVIYGLKRDPGLRKIIEEKEAELAAGRKGEQQ